LIPSRIRAICLPAQFAPGAPVFVSDAGWGSNTAHLFRVKPVRKSRCAYLQNCPAKVVGEALRKPRKTRKRFCEKDRDGARLRARPRRCDSVRELYSPGFAALARFLASSIFFSAPRGYRARRSVGFDRSSLRNTSSTSRPFDSREHLTATGQSEVPLCGGRHWDSEKF
jgi:hypothetical protein